MSSDLYYSDSFTEKTYTGSSNFPILITCYTSRYKVKTHHIWVEDVQDSMVRHSTGVLRMQKVGRVDT